MDIPLHCSWAVRKSIQSAVFMLFKNSEIGSKEALWSSFEQLRQIVMEMMKLHFYS